MDFATSVSLATLALALEAVVGYPDALYRVIGHPVTWIGAWIGLLDRTLNRDAASPTMRRLAGILALVLILALPCAIALAVTVLLPRGLVGLPLLVVLAAALPAQRSLDAHVSAVADGLDRGLEEGRRAVSMIVGRNPAYLDASGVARAAIESLAENFSDGIVAPAFWTAVAGLPGGIAYKAANTADSMIGHRTPRHQAFGWAAARSDDLVNLPASRLAALWLVLAALLVPGCDPRAAVAAVRRDAPRHRSPNAGWPEAAMAGALGLRLAGPRVYGETMVDDAFMGDGRRDADAADIRRALRLYRAACWIEGEVLVALGLVLFLFAGY